jgi:hypothetical protein
VFIAAPFVYRQGLRHAPYTLYQHGHGIGTYAQGDRYFGNWKKGKVHRVPLSHVVRRSPLTFKPLCCQRDAFGVYIGRQGERFFGNWRDDQVPLD